MLELLVVDRSHEDVRLERLSRDSRGEVVLPSIAVSRVDEDLRHLLRLGSSKRRPVLELAFKDSRLAREAFEHLADRHARGESVRVHDDVGARSLVVERHVLLRNDEAANSLLPVARRELVSELGATSLPNEDLDERVVLVRIGDEDFVDVAWDRSAVGHARVLPRSGAGAHGRRLDAVVVRVRGGLLVDEDLTGVDLLADVRESILVEDPVARHDFAVLLRRVGETIVAALSHGDQLRSTSKEEASNSQSVRVALEQRHILAEDLTATKATIETGLVENESVLDVVTRETHDGDGGVLSGGELVVADEFDRASPAHGGLRVDHEVEEGVDPLELVVGDGADCLLSHGALVRVSRRLVVVRVGDEAGDGAEEAEGLDLEVSRVGEDLGLVEGDVGVVLLVDVEVLDEPLVEERVE